MWEIKPNTGSMFINERKETENQPDFKGKININGKMYYLSGWKKSKHNGEEYINLTVSEMKR